MAPLSVLLADVAHDLRNHLNEVSCAEQLLRDDASLDAAQRRALKHIQAGGERLATTVEALIELARIDSGRYVTEPLPVDVGTLRQIVATALPGATVTIRGLLPDHQVLLDPFAFRHALRAEDAMHARGQRITLEPAGRLTRVRVEAEAAPESGALALALSARLWIMLGAQALPGKRCGWTLMLEPDLGRSTPTAASA